jgi:uncharacterized membrane protein YagU involved in acid resistance
MATSSITPLGALARGIVAGFVGTAVMDGYQKLVSTLRDSGSHDSDDSEGTRDWSKAPAPAQVGRRIVKGVFRRDVSGDYIDLLTNVVHWTYGISWGGLYGILKPSLSTSSLWSGPTFGGAVWGAGYVVLPAMKLYKPIWEYPPQTLALDLSYHLVYGLGVAGVFEALEEV